MATPLKVSSSSKAEQTKETSGPTSGPSGTEAVMGSVEDISSAHELTAFVENLLTQIESKFDDMSTQVLERMNAMSARVDALEASIQDLINGDVPPQQTLPVTGR